VLCDCQVKEADSAMYNRLGYEVREEEYMTQASSREQAYKDSATSCNFVLSLI